MNISLLALSALLITLLLMGLLRRHWLFTAWGMSFLVFPTARVKIGEAPIYLYDLIAVGSILSLLLHGQLKSWPRGIPRWHWWFISMAFLLSVVFGVVKHGMAAETAWIWIHSSLAWIAFAFGVIIASSDEHEGQRQAVTWGILFSAIILCIIAIIQYAEFPGTEFLSALFYGDLGSEESVERLRHGLETNRAPGPHFSPTTFAGMALLIVAAFWLGTDENDRRKRWLVLFASTITVLCTVSRHAMVAAIIGLAVTIVVSESKKRIQLILALGLAGLVISTPAVGFLLKESWSYRISKLNEGMLEDDNVAARVVWGPARLAEFIGNEPLVLLTGAGMDPEKLASKSAHESGFDSGFVSNGFLLMLYYLGIVGFICHAMFWLWAIHVARRFPSHSRGVVCGFVATAIVIVGSDNYGAMYEPAIALLFLMVGLMAGRWRLESAEEALEEKDSEGMKQQLSPKAYAT